MDTYPLKSISLETAIQFQFRLVDKITREFTGCEFLTRGDLGVVQGLNKPETTLKAEKIIASFFDAEAASFVRGSGTSAIRSALFSTLKAGDTILVHTSPIYKTTQISMEMMGLKTVTANFNDLKDIEKKIKENKDIQCALVQHTRQSINDSYHFEEVIKIIKACKQIPVITDDNYAVMKVTRIGSQCGADLACFSTFKLLGPEGIGCVVGKKKYINAIIQCNYSGGMQTQGHEALDVLRGLVYAPVAFAIQAQVTEECINRINNGEIRGIKQAFLVNAQSKVLIVEFNNNIAKQVLEEAQKLGAAPHPIGAESKYEIIPMFYRVSGTFLAKDAALGKRMIRINPMRSGCDTVLRILKESVERAERCF